jgi:hypothetical protein
MEERPPIWRVAANIFNEESRTADKLILQLGGWARCLQLLTVKTYVFCYEIFTEQASDKNEIGLSCSAYGGEESCIEGFGGET